MGTILFQGVIKSGKVFPEPLFLKSKLFPISVALLWTPSSTPKPFLQWEPKPELFPLSVLYFQVSAKLVRSLQLLLFSAHTACTGQIDLIISNWAIDLITFFRGEIFNSSVIILRQVCGF